MDTDSLWEEDLADHIPQAEWTKISSEFTNVGGIVAGKETFLQVGFDAGFADVGVPLGRELGNLRGVAAAMGFFLTFQKPGSDELEELRHISCHLSAIQFSNIARHDLEAEQHAKEHLDLGVVENTTGTVPQESRTMEDVAKLRERLVMLSAKLGLPGGLSWPTGR